MNLNINADSASAIYFNVSETMKNAGIIGLKIVDADLIFNLSGGTKVSVFISLKDRSISRISVSMRKKLKHIVTEAAFIDIESQLIERRNEIFGIEPNDSDKSDHAQSTILSNISSSREHYKKLNITYKQWQQLVKGKYTNLQKVTLKNFPEAWPILQFSLAVKSVLNMDGCTLPFMGVILAIPSSMKTLVIELFRKYFRSLYSDNFTPNAFESHNAALTEEQLQKVDLLPKLNNKLFLTPELAPIFTANEDELRKTLGIITRVLDGHGLETDSGAQGHRKYGNTYFVWIGAGVEIPYRVWKLLGTLGHKLYVFRPHIPEKTITDLVNIAKENNFQSKFKEVEDALLDYFVVMESVPESDNSRIDENGIAKIKWNEENAGEQCKALECIAHVANLLSRLRGTVYVSESKTWKTNYSNEEKPNGEMTAAIADGPDYDTDYAIIEDPSRAVVLLRNLAIGNAISQGRSFVSLEDIPLIINVGLSTTTRPRSDLIRLLLRNNGELTTSIIVRDNMVSAPFAKKTMRELAGLGIVDISSLSGHNNSELRIKLKDEYTWFKSKEFQDLTSNTTTKTGVLSEDSTTENLDDGEKAVIAVSSSGQFQLSPYECSSDLSTLTHNSGMSHAEIKSTLDTDKNYYEACDSPNLSKSSDSTCFDHILRNNSNQLLVPDSTDINVCDKEIEKNKASLWGPKLFQRVTAAQENSPNSKDLQKQQILQLALDAIKNASTIVSLEEVFQLIYKNNELVKSYLGEKLTQRENRKVRDLSVDIIHNKNIEVVKYRPLLVVRWKPGGGP